MKTIWSLLAPLKDEQMEEYIEVMIKPFLITDPKVMYNSTLALITTCITAIVKYASDFSITYLGISGTYLFLLSIILFADMVSGLVALKWTKEEKSSKKGRRTIYKTGAYMIFIFAAYSMFKEVEDKSSLFSEILKFFHIFLIIHIVFWELFSVDENLKKMNIDLGITTILKTTYTNISNLFKNKTKPQ